MMCPENVYDLIPLPWELKEIVARYLAKMMIAEKLEFPKCIDQYVHFEDEFGVYEETTFAAKYQTWVVRKTSFKIMLDYSYIGDIRYTDWTANQVWYNGHETFEN